MLIGRLLNSRRLPETLQLSVNAGNCEKHTDCSFTAPLLLFTASHFEGAWTRNIPV